MRISLELVNTLIKTIREIENANSFYKWTEYDEMIKIHIIDNELYFSKKLKDESLKKYEYYEQKIKKDKNKYLKIIEQTNNKMEYRDFSEQFVNEIITYSGVKNYKLKNILKYNYDKDELDYLINVIKLFQEVYIDFPSNEERYEMASVLMNALLIKKDDSNSNLYLSEVIKSNYILFQSAIIQDEEFIIIFLRLIRAQLQKNNQRIELTIKLYIEYKEIIEKDNIRQYLFKNTMFTISDFVEDNAISYNTGKKYLKEMVIDEIIIPIKIGRNNAFIFTELYSIWIK